MIQKLFYLNDTRKEVAVHKHNLAGDPIILGPAGHCVIEVEMPENATLFVKNWGDYVLVSYTTYQENDDA